MYITALRAYKLCISIYKVCPKLTIDWLLNMNDPFVCDNAICLGPWFIGRLLSEKWALVFVNGVYFLDGTFLPSGLNHVFGLFHLAMFDIPMVLIISYLLRASNKNGDCAFPKLARKKSSASNLIKRRLLLFIALILLIWQSHKSFEVYLNYGLIAVLSNIVEFYCIFLYIYQLHFAMRYRSRSQ